MSAHAKTVHKTALFSECGLYRYRLIHDYGGSGPVISLGMVNPSLADDEKNDPTMSRVDGFASRMGASRVVVWNKFALISPYVKDLRSHADPVGPLNDEIITDAVKGADIHIVAWGPMSKLSKPLRNRWRDVHSVIIEAGGKPMSWGTAKDGHPRHPLMLAYATPLVPWAAP